jgi:uncharacterized Zn-binding protein involved in type VI secretion
MPGVHRDTDARACGAKTKVVGQTTVKANGLLVAVNGDPCDHGGGELIAGSDNVKIGGKLVVNHTPDGSAADGLCPPLGGAHCAPETAQGSGDVNVGDG